MFWLCHGGVSIMACYCAQKLEWWWPQKTFLSVEPSRHKNFSSSSSAALFAGKHLLVPCGTHPCAFQDQRQHSRKAHTEQSEKTCSLYLVTIETRCRRASPRRETRNHDLINDAKAHNKIRLVSAAPRSAVEWVSAPAKTRPLLGGEVFAIFFPEQG